MISEQEFGSPPPTPGATVSSFVKNGTNYALCSTAVTTEQPLSLLKGKADNEAQTVCKEQVSLE